MSETTISQVSPQPTFTPQSGGGGGKKILLPIIIVIIILVIIFGSGKFLGSRQQAIPEPTPFPTPQPTSTPTPTPTPSVSPTPTPKATPTKKPTPAATSSAVTSKGLSVRVLNGSGIAGRAASTADYLKGLGYDIASTGNADKSDYENTQITIKSSKQSLLAGLKSDLAAKFKVGTKEATLSATDSADAEVILGKN